MAKKSSSVSSLPGTSVKPTQVETQEREEHHTQVNTVEVEEKEDKTVTKNVSVDMPTFVMQGYSKKRIDFTLSGREASAAKALRDGAEITESQLPNGKYISTPADAIKLFLNRIADEIGL